MTKTVLYTLASVLALVLLVDWFLKRGGGGRVSSGSVGSVGSAPILDLHDAFRELKTGLKPDNPVDKSSDKDKDLDGD